MTGFRFTELSAEDREMLINTHNSMDDWKYEMRREIQEIVPGVFLGPFAACRNVENLKAKGITNILCIVDPSEARLLRIEHLSQAFLYKQFIVNDSNLQNLIQIFPTTSQHIRDVLQQGGKIVVCCNGGMSRSPTFVIAYIMEIFDTDASTAYHFVQAKRLCINPNDGFKSQLKEYEPIYKARKVNSAMDVPEAGNQQRRRRRSGTDDDEYMVDKDQQLRVETKRFLGDEAQQQNGANANVNAGYSSMLL
ncbi:protein-tyrosine phosphatase-like protein [Mycotypha africana]|uniref:protein-tyrosine phosphatase-like protein n=1 Tax=Mycotypha africana TaxID=64632 RepID=UPI0022FFE761|nr:protein-tyrosine phosphatase-like protein [Mycotypha africana]KAI8992072.1 protein-tyrosine phosphatase-like protein [Mycotypha africana]